METPNYINIVPNELLTASFSFLSPDELTVTCLVCHRFNQIVKFLLTTNEYSLVLAQSLLGKVQRNVNESEVLKEINEVIDFVSGYFPLQFKKPGENKEILAVLKMAIERVSEALLSQPKMERKKLSYWYGSDGQFELSTIYCFCSDKKSEVSKNAAFRLTLSKLKRMKASISSKSYILPLAIQARLSLKAIQTLVTHKAPINVELPTYLGGELGIIEWCLKQGAPGEIIKFLLLNGGNWGAHPKEFLADAEISEETFRELKKINFLKKEEI